ncbi:Uncharacterised protein [Mycobacteroides abscessus subsp. abscessus]|nr:Uncharacterised protein [Mycobacteroides abscessus subsp. abscessus]
MDHMCAEPGNAQLQSWPNPAVIPLVPVTIRRGRFSEPRARAAIRDVRRRSNVKVTADMHLCDQYEHNEFVTAALK